MKHATHLMARHRAVGVAAVLWLLTLSGGAAHAEPPAQNSDLLLWYDAAATRWVEALPVGNGRMGAMVFGGVEHARFQFNEDSLWAGGPHSYAHAGAAEYLPKIRQLLLAGNQPEAERLAMEHFMSEPLRQIAVPADGRRAAGFRRPGQRPALSPVARPGHGHRRHHVQCRRCDLQPPDTGQLSRPGDCDSRVVRQAGRQLSFTAKLTSPQTEVEVNSLGPQALAMTGRVHEYEQQQVGRIKSVLTFAADLQVLSTDGQVSSTGGALTIKSASQATLVLVAATSFVNFRDVSGNPQVRCQQDLQQLAGKSFDELRGPRA